MQNKDWWMPYNNTSDERLDWLCDHLGDASAVMTRLWKELCKERPELPLEGFDFGEDE